ncbi:MAG: hypothetical protein PHU42_01720 [Patescibacteria group bacterium]|nr:hypothetical protein [Patescibacteria group bacterium]
MKRNSALAKAGEMRAAEINRYQRSWRRMVPVERASFLPKSLYPEEEVKRKGRLLTNEEIRAARRRGNRIRRIEKKRKEEEKKWEGVIIKIGY